jgi:hypothetical protein
LLLSPACPHFCSIIHKNGIKMKLLLKIILAFSLAQSSGVVVAQSLDLQVVGNAGADIATNSGSLSFTVGETCIQSSTNAGLYVGSGFQQAIESDLVSHDEPMETQPLALRLYPNPCSGWTILEADRPVRVQLYRADGRTASESTMITQKAKISMAGHPADCYWVKVLAVDGSWQQTLPLYHVGQ